LQGLDIAAFLADDAALHLFVFQFDTGDGAFGGYLAGHALHGANNYGAGLLLGIFFGFILQFGDQAGEIIFNIPLGHLHELLGSLILGELGDLFQLFLLFGADGANLFFEFFHLGLALT
jgi:hypothetical protein